MYECFYCCTKSVVWDSDFGFADFGYEEERIRNNSYLPLYKLWCRN